MAAETISKEGAGNFPSLEGKNIALLSYGSRGDVQPFVALAGGLQRAGCNVLFVTNIDHTAFVEAFGIPAVGTADSCRDDHKGPAFIEGIKTGDFRKFWAWHMTQKAEKMPVLTALERFAVSSFAPDFLYATPLTYTNVCRLAQELNVPMVLGSLFPMRNPLSYLGFRPFRPPAHMTLVHFSPEITTMPFFMRMSHRITGFLIVNGEGGKGDQCEDDQLFGGEGCRRRLQEFLASGESPVYFGWGSMVVPPETACLAVRALKRAGMRGIILGGWAGLSPDAVKGEPDQLELEKYISKNVLFTSSAPHEWLFQRCSITVHHGGAGTVAAALRAGVPTVVTPCGLDQTDNGNLVQDRGCGLTTCHISKLTSEILGDALQKCAKDEEMRATCKSIGMKLQSEDGVSNAVFEISKYMTKVNQQR